MIFKCCLGVVTYKHHHIQKHLIFTIFLFVSMSKPKSIYVVSMWSFFHFHINIISLKHTHLFLEHRTYSSERLLKYRTYSSECPGRSFNFGFSKEGAIRGRRSLNIKKRYQNTFILSLSSNNKSSNNNWRITTLMFLF